MYSYVQSEFKGVDGADADLFTVGIMHAHTGYFGKDGRWEPESDHPTREEAADRVHYLNGDSEEQK